MLDIFFAPRNISNVMPFDINGLVTGACQSCKEPGMLSGMLASPIWTAILILGVLLIMTVVVFRDVETYDTSLFMLSLRLVGYMSLVVLGAVFLNNSIVIDDMRKANESSASRELFDRPERNDDDVPIKPVDSPTQPIIASQARVIPSAILTPGHSAMKSPGGTAVPPLTSMHV